MGPLAIYVSLLVFFVLAGGAVWIWRHVPTRSCPQCEARVEIGKARCQSCGYKITSARYYR
jgi:hypothetical protein